VQDGGVGAFHHLTQLNKGVVTAHGMDVCAADDYVCLLSGLIIIMAN
jgi:hypothetical protein